MSEFRVLLYLNNLFNDHRSLSRIYIDENIKCIGDLERYICDVFEIDVPIYLMADCHYLPPFADIRVLEKDESIVIMKKDINLQHCTNERKLIKKRRIYVPITNRSKLEVHNTKTKYTEESPGSNCENDTIMDNLESENVLNLCNKIEKEVITKVDKKIVHKQQDEETTSDDNSDVGTRQTNWFESNNVCKIANSTAIVNEEETSNQNETQMLLEKDILHLKEEVNLHSMEKNNLYLKESNTHWLKENDISLTHELMETDEVSLITNGDKMLARNEVCMNNIKHTECQNKKENHCLKEEASSPYTESNKKFVITNNCVIRKPFAVSDAIQLLNSNENSESTIDSNNVPKHKRKRVRKRKQKNKPPLLSDDITNIPNDSSKVLNTFSIIKPSLHLRFDSGDEDDTSTTIENVDNQMKVHISNFKHRTETINVQDDKEKKIESNSNENIYNLDAPLSDSVIKAFPKMTNHKPRKYDVIGFKILKMSEDYCPTISEYIAGKVLDYDAKENVVCCEILYGREEMREPNGKFSLTDVEIQEDEKEIDNKTYFKWSDLKETRLLFP